MNGSGIGAGESTLESRPLEESLEGDAGGTSVVEGREGLWIPMKQ